MQQPFLHLERSAKAKPNSIAISSPAADMTYGELSDSAIRFARVFRDLGIKKGEVVGTALQPLLDLVVSEALFHEGTVGAQIPVGQPDLVSRTFDWLVVEKVQDRFPHSRQIVIDQSFLDKVSKVIAVASPNLYSSPQDLCRLSFSSGTTGEPKVIPVSVDCLEDRSVDRTKQWMPERPYLCMLGLSTGLTFMSFYWHIFAGETFVLSGSVEQVPAQLARHQISCLMGSPHQLGLLIELLEKSDEYFESVKTVMSAGSVLPDAIYDRYLNRLGVRIIATYASTEAGSVAIRDGRGSFEGYAGRLFEDVEVKILDDDNNELADEQIGRVAINRPRQPKHYLNDPETTAKSFIDGFFIPGDLGYLKGKELYLVGRASEIINAAGIKVDPARVESVAREFAGISDAAVFALTDSNHLERIALVFTSQKAIDASALADFLAIKLGESAPSRLARVAEINRNHMGKVNRRELAEVFSNL